MKQKNETRHRIFDRTTLLTSLLCLLPLVFSAATYKDLPEQVAIHWGANGNPNGWAPKWLAAFGLPLLMAVLNLILQIGSNSDPKGERRSSVLLTLCRWSVAAITLTMVPITLMIALGKEIPIVTVTSCVLGAVLIVVGNYLPKCRQNYTLGIKLPWTLNDEENWDKTHRMAGPLWILAGVVFALMGFFFQNLFWVGFVILGLAILIPVAYSYCLFRKSTKA